MVLYWPRSLPRFASLGFPGSKRFTVKVSVPSPFTLVVHADSSRVRIVPWEKTEFHAEGTAYKPSDNVRFRLERIDSRLYGRFTITRGSAVVRAPITALGVVADSSLARIEAANTVLRYVSVKADASSISGEACLKPGGGVYVNLDASTVHLLLKPRSTGRYWVDIEADASAVRVEFAGAKRYEVVEEKLNISRLNLGVQNPNARVVVEVRVKADASLVKLL